MLPEFLYTADETRALDQAAIEGHGVPGYTLMRRAGEACWKAITGRWPGVSGISVYCGAGNNAGDGYVIAALASAAGMRAQVAALADPRRLTGDAATAYDDFIREGGQVETFGAGFQPQGEVLVDALLGTGLTRPVSGAYAGAVAQINAQQLPVFSVDIPSGLSADSGAVLGCAVQADTTLTFIGLKRGLFTGDGVDCAGEVRFDGLKVPESIYAEVGSECALLDQKQLGRWLGPRPRNVHKGKFGAVGR